MARKITVMGESHSNALVCNNLKSHGKEKQEKQKKTIIDKGIIGTAGFCLCHLLNGQQFGVKLYNVKAHVDFSIQRENVDLVISY